MSTKIMRCTTSGISRRLILVHSFLTMECDLMARSKMFVDMHIKHIQWRSDWLIFYFGTSKVNQTKYRASAYWHVYSNINNPASCTVLALVKYLFYNLDILNTNSLLFPGNYQYKIFLKIFHKVIKDNFDCFHPLRVEKGMLGNHSIRKEDITIVATGCTVSTPMASICMRAGWSMGPRKYWYIHYEKAGDQFLGRSVTVIYSLRN